MGQKRHSTVFCTESSRSMYEPAPRSSRCWRRPASTAMLGGSTPDNLRANPLFCSKGLVIMAVNAPLNRKLRMGLVGGGQGSFIGKVHSIAAILDNRAALVAGALSSNPEKA